MKSTVKIALLFTFSFFFLGCNEETIAFDRVKTMSTASPYYAPHSRYIKEQTIHTETNGQLESTQVMKYDRTGNTTFSSMTGFVNYMSNRESTTDYEHNTFNTYDQARNINVKNGSIEHDTENNIFYFKGINQSNGVNYLSEIRFIENKIILSKEQVMPFFSETRVEWQGDLPSSMLMTKFKNDIEYEKITALFLYDEKERISSISMQAAFGQKEPTDFIVTFEKYNQYGDWTTATVKRGSIDIQVLMTREIKYY